MADDFEPLTLKKGKNDKLVLNWKKKGSESLEEQVQMIGISELEAIKEEAKKQGYQEGLQQGVGEVESLRIKLANTLDSLNSPLSCLDDALERNILELVIFLAKEVLDAEFKLSAEHIKPHFLEICHYLPINQTKAKLRLSPHDAACFRELYAELNTEFSLDNLVEDTSLSNGDFRVFAEDGEIDGRFEPRVRALIEKALNNTLEVDDEG